MRKKSGVRLWNDMNLDWYQLSEEEKIFCGMERSKAHNKLFRFKQSYNENTTLFANLVKYCKEEEINFCVIVPPATKYYRNNLNVQFKEKFYETLDCVDGIIHLLDLFDEVSYEDIDFADADHLSDSGSFKMTLSVLELLKTLS